MAAYESTSAYEFFRCLVDCNYIFFKYVNVRANCFIPQVTILYLGDYTPADVY